MKRTKIIPSINEFPSCYQSLLQDCAVYDSSCSPEARVYYIDRDGGLFLKRSPKGTLEREATMTRFFHQKGLAAEVLDHRSESFDWLLTTRVEGEDCTHRAYLDNPTRLCDTYAQILRELHEEATDGCPVQDRMTAYFALAEQNRTAGVSDLSFLASYRTDPSAEDAWRIVEEGRASLVSDTLIHGDYCLPNVVLKDWRLSGLIDLGNAGVGDRHVDLFWGAWTLAFNLGTDQYRSRFFDAYGRDRVDTGRLLVVAAAETFG